MDGEFENRKITTQVKDTTGWVLYTPINPKLIWKTIPVYKLTPEEAQKLNKKGYVLRWIHKTEHSKGEPRLRLYQLIGQNGKI